jgi:anti-sigma factor RsiW
MSNIDRDNPMNGGEHVSERLSDYMDGLLSSDEREAVRMHLEGCAECRADYVELRATQKLMQNMPTLPAPRAFTLTPEMAGQVRKPSLWERLFVPRNAPRLATGSVVAFLLLIVVLAGTNGLPGSNGATLTSPLVSTSAGGSGPAAPKAAAAPTNTTAAASASNFSDGQTSTAGGQAEPAVPPAAAVAPTPEAPGSANSAQAAETSTTLPAQDGNRASITPDTSVANSGTGSPTTTTLNGVTPPSEEGTNAYYDRSVVPGSAGTDHTQVATPAEDNRTGWVALQLGLLALGLALAAAALIAWRRT